MHAAYIVRAKTGQDIIETIVVKVPGLRRQRYLATLTQKQLADRSTLKRLTIGRLEHGGEAFPSTVAKLARALDCTPGDLITATR